MAAKRLYRSEENKIVAGILGGLGEYFNVDPAILRLLWVVITVFTGFLPGIITYFLARCVVPKAPGQKVIPAGDSLL